MLAAPALTLCSLGAAPDDASPAMLDMVAETTPTTRASAPGTPLESGCAPGAPNADNSLGVSAGAVSAASPGEKPSAARRASGDQANVASSSMAKDVGTEDVRTMTPRQKADYWYNRLDALDTMEDRQDRRAVRQAADLASKNEHTSDPALKGKLDELATKLAHIAIVDRLTSGGITKATDLEVQQALDLLTILGLHIPSNIQIRHLTRRLSDFAKGPSEALTMFKVLAPWCMDPCAHDGDLLFAGHKPVLHSVDASDAGKVDVFVGWVVYGLIQPILAKGCELPQRR